MNSHSNASNNSSPVETISLEGGESVINTEHQSSAKSAGLYVVVNAIKDILFRRKKNIDLELDETDIPINGIPQSHDQDWFTAIFQPLKPAYKQALLMALGINVIGLLSSIFSLQVYDRVVAKGGNATLVALAAGMFIAIGIDFMLREGRSLLMRKVGSRVEVAIARTVYQRLTQLPALELEARPPAFWQTVFRDVELIRTVMTGAPALLLVDLPFLVLTIALLAVIAPPLIPIVVCLVLMFGLLAWRSEAVLKDASETEKKLMLSRDAVLYDLAAGRTQLKAQGPSSLLDQKWEQYYSTWMQSALSRSADGDRFRDISQGMTIASTVLMTSFGAIAILNQLMSMGALIAANILTGKLVGPLVQLVGQWRSFGQFADARKRLDTLFAVQLDRDSSPVALERPKGLVSMENLSFSYPGSESLQVVKVTGHMGVGGLHAIVGNNGSGKTTLLKLLRGLYTPTEGRVLIQNADIKQFGQRDLARWIGYLPQQPRLMQGTIKENLIMVGENISDEQIVRATRLAGAYDFIVALPEGFDTNVGEAGSRLSNGQRKRIAIAQTLIQDPPIILMDEPTSDLDSQAEKKFVQSLRSLAADHTIIMVTHSPEILKACDGVVVMENGRVSVAGKAADVFPRIGFAETRPKVVVAND